jgi:hypothetical protein
VAVFAASGANAAVGTNRSTPDEVLVSTPAAIACSSARQKDSSAKASAITPTWACWRTRATACGASSFIRSSSVSSQASASGTK